jgi:hypothetical protein
MKKIIFTILLLFITVTIFSQTTSTNTSPVGMEHNVLFNAVTRYQVSQVGNAVLNTEALFDGRFAPSYTETAPSTSSPTVILIENLPNWHTQRGAWVGWSTRYWQAKRFKIEGYDSYKSANIWKTIVDYSTEDYPSTKTDFITKIPSSGSYTKLRFTFYNAYGTNGRLGVSELFFLHPEVVRPYEGLLGASNDTWSKSGNDINYIYGNVGIGTASPNAKLEVQHSSVRTVEVNPQNQLDVTGNSSIVIKEFVPSIEFHDSSSSSSSAITFANRNKFYIGKKTGAKITESSLFNVNLNNGNIGVGTTDPKDFKLGVNGKIAATEVKVAAYANWPDFVFKKEYNLPTLTEVEKHIKEKGHLQNILSAAEVKKEGFFLGEMDAKLLQKIEELTLYTIQQEKQLKKQAEEVRELKELVNKLIQKNK